MTTHAWKKWALAGALLGATSAVLSGCNDDDDGGPSTQPTATSTITALPTAIGGATATATARPGATATATARPGATATATPRPGVTATAQATATSRPGTNAFFPGNYVLSYTLTALGESTPRTLNFAVSANGVITPTTITIAGLGTGLFTGGISPAGTLNIALGTGVGTVSFPAALANTNGVVKGSGEIVANAPGLPTRVGTFTATKQ